MTNILNKILLGLLTLALVAMAVPAVPKAEAVGPTPIAGVDYVPGELIVKFKSGFLPDALFSAKYGIKSSEKILGKLDLNPGFRSKISSVGLDRLHLLKFANPSSDILTLAKTLAADLGAEYAEPNFIYRTQSAPSDPLYVNQWALAGGYSYNGFVTNDAYAANINFEPVWDIINGPGIQNNYEGIEVAVIDTGIDYNHPDLSANIARDESGFMIGYNAIDNAPPMDTNGHGTKVAGIIGARDNSIGMIGVNWRVKLIPIKVFSGGAAATGNMDNIIEGLMFAGNRGIQVMNLSWGGRDFSEPLFDAMNAIVANNPRTLFIAAAGNYDSTILNEADKNTDINPFYPASYHLNNIVAVAYTDVFDDIGASSNFGAISVDLGAPGSNILSTIHDRGAGNRGISGVPDTQGRVCYFHTETNNNNTPDDPSDDFIEEVLDDGCFQKDIGTSYAAAHVSGAVSLYWKFLTDKTAEDVKQDLLVHTDRQPFLAGKVLSGGRLNIKSMLDQALLPPAPRF